MNVKTLLKNNKRLCNLAAFIYSFGRNRTSIVGSANQIIREGAFMTECRICICGSNNKVILGLGGAMNNLKDITIHIYGNNNEIRLGRNVSSKGLAISVENDNNCIVLGDNFMGGGQSELAAIEGTEITFGNSCMLSANITVRTGDSHSILDATTRKRINTSKSVHFGDHVWIGNTVLVFKGAEVGANCVIGGGSIVTGKVFPPNSVIGGNPAKVIKGNVDWLVERI